MILIEDKLISEELLDKAFVCKLSACKGACCVAGDGGAPLEQEELAVLEEIYPIVRPYLPGQSKKAILEQGKYVKEGGEYATPLVQGKECAYTVFEQDKATCGIEKAYLAGKISFQKPISCHLYPIRITHNRQMEMDMLNYEEWDICAPACHYGKQLGVPVYAFLKAPLTRKYGAEFYAQLDAIAKARNTKA